MHFLKIKYTPHVGMWPAASEGREEPAHQKRGVASLSCSIFIMELCLCEHHTQQCKGLPLPHCLEITPGSAGGGSWWDHVVPRIIPSPPTCNPE